MALTMNYDLFRIVFSTIEDGNMARTQANREEVHRNRKKFFSENSPTGYRVVRVRPSHSSNLDTLSVEGAALCRTTHIRPPRIETDFDFYLDGSDGIMTSERQVSLCVIAGDCVPLFLWNQETRTFGIVHVGLLGTLNNLIGGLAQPLKGFKLLPSDMKYYLGPSINQGDYDVSKSGLWRAIERQVFQSRELRENIEPYLDRGRFFDMKGMIRGQLLSIGVPSEQVDQFEESTASPDSSFFSHYTAIQRGTAPGNFCSLICSLDI